MAQVQSILGGPTAPSSDLQRAIPGQPPKGLSQEEFDEFERLMRERMESTGILRG